MTTTDLQQALDEANRRIAVLEAAIVPFAALAAWLGSDWPAHAGMGPANVADCRRAAGVLACWSCGGEGGDEHGPCPKCGGKGKAGA